jgi:hypothetical protein
MLTFQILTVAIMMMIVFWDFASCGVVDIDRNFRGAYCRHHQDNDGRSTVT